MSGQEDAALLRRAASLKDATDEGSRDLALLYLDAADQIDRPDRPDGRWSQDTIGAVVDAASAFLEFRDLTRDQP